MATQPWVTVAQQWVLSGDPEVDPGLYGRIDRDAVSLLLGASSDPDRDAKAKIQINRMANHYRQKLIQKFQSERAQTSRAFLSDAAQRLTDLRELYDFQQYSTGANFPGESMPNQSTGSTGPIVPTGYGAILLQDDPKYYVASAVPKSGTSGSLAGTADNGEWIIVEGVSQAANGLYLNRGSLASPLWVKWDTNDLINYVTNPGELLECGYIRTIFYLKGYGTLMDKGDFELRLDKMPTAAGISLKEALEAESLAFGILEVDASADGLLSDTEKEDTGNRHWVF